MKITVREMVETAMLVACAIILDMPFLKFRIGENGGSISLTMIPLFILALRVGPLKSFIGIGIIYGLITCLMDGWGIITFPFDYLLAYGSISLIGFFRRKIMQDESFIKGVVWLTIGTLIACASRFLFSCISSVVLYEVSVGAAIIYNLAYIVPSCVLTLDVLILLYKPLLKINKRYQLKSIC